MPPGSQCVQVSSSVFNQCVGIKEGSCEYTIMSSVSTSLQVSKSLLVSSIGVSLQVSLQVSSLFQCLQSVTHRLTNSLPNGTMCVPSSVPSSVKSLLVSSVSDSQTHKEPTQCDNVCPFKCQVSFSVFSQCVPSPQHARMPDSIMRPGSAPRQHSDKVILKINIKCLYQNFISNSIKYTIKKTKYNGIVG